VTDRIWPCVELQWEWLGGLPRLHRAAVIGAGARGTGLAVALARAGLEVDLGAQTADQAARIGRAGRNDADLPGVPLPDGVNVVAADALELGLHDLVVFAVPPRELPGAVAAHGGRIPARAGALVLARGLVPPAGTLPSAYLARHVAARAVASLAGPGADGALAEGAAVVVASADAPFLAQLATVLRAAGLDVTTTTEVAAVELAGTAAGAAGPASAESSPTTHRPRRPRAA
jgi:glycerol-3-phosphate dehydrogenase (NAD(P)+)